MTIQARHFVAPLLLVLLTDTTTHAQGFSPDDAVKRMKVADGFEVKVIAHEPLVRQPVTMSFDHRDRLWVIQYLQYPTPAGLKAVHVDKYLRTKYDRVPEPPPHGPRGKDKITILYDPDKKGRFQKSKDFVTGLNLASGMALGHGGVFVAQPPYLLFYPDKDGNDVPDGDPQVLLKGFGMEDAHAFANSLQWGPDGWLYGAHGSTSYANIRGISFVQGIWRYHPLTKEFELFSEGGGNTWGLDFDRQGNVIAGTNFGRKAMLHQLQGAYYVKNFVKHGALKNPHAYGYFDHVPYKGFIGGHVTCGGIMYQGGLFPDRLRDQYIAGNPLSNAIHWHRMTKHRSTYKAEHGGVLIDGKDTWFRPVDCDIGPDGAFYIADWYDKRITHHDPRDNWDRRNGRIYRLAPRGAKTTPFGNLAKLSSLDLVKLLKHKNNWQRRQARLLLAERRDKTVWPVLRRLVDCEKGQLALEALWALYVSGGFDDNLAERWLRHESAEVRMWTIRLLGDAKKVTPEQQRQLVQLARSDVSPLVRSQLACAARRWPGKDGLPIVGELLRRDEDVDGPFVPMLLWWAIEEKAKSDRDRVQQLLDKAADWRRPLVQKFVLERLGRRYMASNTNADYRMCATLLARAPGDGELRKLITGMEKALQGKQRREVPEPLRASLRRLRKQQPADLLIWRFAIRLGDESAFQAALRSVANPKTPVNSQVSLLETLGQTGRKECTDVLLTAFTSTKNTRLKQAALSALQTYRGPRIPETVLRYYPKLTGRVRSDARTLLVSREASALQLLQAIDKKQLAKTELTLDQVRQIHQFKNKTIHKLIAKHWGKIAPATADDKLGRIRHYNRLFRRHRGDLARGKLLFKKHCATCHTLFGEGNKIGPDLTGADRQNRAWLLMHIVDPSAVQRLEYANYLLVMNDGRTLTGVIQDAKAETVTLVNAKNKRSVLPRSGIAEMIPSQASLMPERILEPLNDQQFCDLFAYLQTKQAPSDSAKKNKTNK